MRATSNLLLILITATLVGCNHMPVQPEVRVETVTVKVPVPIPCQTPEPEKPALVFPTIREEDDIFSKVKVLLADRLLMTGYITQLETAFKSCK